MHLLQPCEHRGTGHHPIPRLDQDFGVGWQVQVNARAKEDEPALLTVLHVLSLFDEPPDAAGDGSGNLTPDHQP